MCGCVFRHRCDYGRNSFYEITQYAAKVKEDEVIEKDMHLTSYWYWYWYW